MELTPHELDTLRELINMGVGQAAGIMNDMLSAHIHLSVPVIKVYTPEGFLMDWAVQGAHTPLLSIAQENTARMSAVRLRFMGPFSGSAMLVFPPKSALNLVTLVAEEEEMQATDLNEIRIGTLMEVGNIVLNGVMGTIGNILGHHMIFSIPSYREETIRNLLAAEKPDSDWVILLVQARFDIKQHQINGDIMLILHVSSLTRLLDIMKAV